MKQKTLNIIYTSDPQHGWYRIRDIWIKKYGIDAKKISDCSYRGFNGILFLEEDCDAKLLFEALERKGVKPNIIELVPSKKPSKIRSYPRFYYDETGVEPTKPAKRVQSKVKTVESDYSSKVPASKTDIDDEEILASGFAYTDEAPIFNEAENV